MRVGTSLIDTGVYCIFNTMSEKRYIGSACTSLKKRFIHHRAKLRAGKHRNRHLQLAWNRYGESAFEFIVLTRCPPSECLKIEQTYIDNYRTTDRRFGYNSRPAAGNQLGFRHSDETKEILRQATKRNWEKLTPAERQKAIEPMRAKSLSPEARTKISKANRGRKHTEKTLARMREIQRLQAFRKGTPEVRAKLRAAWTRRKLRGPTDKEIQGRLLAAAAHRGLKRSDETKAKMSVAQKGRVVPEERRRKIAAALTGKNLSEEHRKKIGSALRGYVRSDEFKAKIKASWAKRRATQ